MDEIFMAYDVRGRDITTHDAFLLGRSLGTFFPNTSCLVGWDSRATSPKLAEHLIEGLRMSGLNVTIGGFMPGPVCYFKIHNNFDFGIYITASHLPKEYNGFKIVMKDGTGIDPEDLKKVKEIFYSFKFSKEQPGDVKQDLTITNDYTRFIRENFGRLPIKCVIDCFNGSTGINVFNLLDSKVINSEPLPDFGGRDPEPSEENLHRTAKLVVDQGADFGVGLDGDGDRSVFIDEKGNVIDGNKMTMLFAKYAIKRRPGPVVAPVSVSSFLEKVVYPQKVIWCKVGHTFIEKTLVQNNASFGGEYSSHFYWNEFYPFSDGILSTFMLAKLINDTGKKFSELLAEVPDIYVVKGEVEFPTHEIKERVANQIISKLKEEHTNAITLDGIKFKDGEEYILIRQSQTRHTVKVFVESKDKQRAKEILNNYLDYIRSFQ